MKANNYVSIKWFISLIFLSFLSLFITMQLYLLFTLLIPLSQCPVTEGTTAYLTTYSYYLWLWLFIIIFIGVIASIWLIQAEKHLRAQLSLLKNDEAHYRQLFTDSSIVKLLVDPDTLNIVEANQAASQFYGYSIDTLKSMSIADISVRPKETVLQAVQETKQGYLSHFFSQHRLASGEIREVEVYSGTITLNGKVLTYGITHNVTESKQAELALKQAHERFLLVLNSIDAVIYVADMQTYEILFANHYAQKLFNGKLTGNICWQALQKDQAGPCTFCTNNKLISPAGQPTGLYIWEFQNTLNRHWFHIQDRAIEWVDGRLVRLEVATDITLRKQMEEALQQNGARLEEAQKLAHLGHWEWDLVTGEEQWSEEMFHIFGLSPYHVRLTHEAFEEMLHPDDRTAVLTTFSQAMAEGIPYNIEFKVICPRVSRYARTIRHIQALGKLIRDDQNKPLRFIGTAQDITERKQIEQALRENEACLKAIFDNITVGIALSDTQGHFIQVNTKWADMLGYTVEALRQDNFFRVMQLENGSTLETAHDPGFINPHRFEKCYLRQDGHVFWGDIAITPIRHPDGLVQTILAVIIDITERKRAEEALQESKKFLQETIDNTNVLVFVKDTCGGYLLVNRAYENVVKLDRAAIMGKSDYAIFPQEVADKIINDDKHVLDTEISLRREETFTIKGRSYTFIISKIPLFDKDKKLYAICGVATDITERKRIEAKLRQAKEDAETALQQLKTTQKQLIESEKMASLGNLVAGVAHEINTPIGIGITAISQLDELAQELKYQYESDNMTRSQLEKYLQAVRQGHDLVLKNLSRAADLVRSFKQVAVDQSSEQQRMFELKSYLEEIILSLKPQLKRTPHQITLHCPEEITLHSYPGTFSQIITNLVMNSLIHGFKNKASGHMQLSALLAPSGTHLVLQYCDDGQGIPVEMMHHTFEPFFTTNRQGGGSGLGLHIIYNLVTHKLNGTIKCDSCTGQGTRFIITVPFTKNSFNESRR